MTPPDFRAGSFQGHEGEVFVVSSAGPPGPIELSLTSATTWGPEVAEGLRQPFTIVLHGPLEPVLPQATYQFDHPAMGSFDIFIVPLGPDAHGMRYEAVFT